MKPVVSNIASLTPLRGIAALLVAIFHFHGYFLRFVQQEQSMFIDKGYLMVDLFFLMSGFLIMHVYSTQFAEKITVNAFKKFMLARFARVYPLHIIVLLVLVAYYFIRVNEVDPFFKPGTILYNTFLLHSLPFNNELTWNVPSWSISAEWWAYMLFPVLCLLLYKKKKITIAVLLTISIASYLFLWFYISPYKEAGMISPKNLDVTYNYGFLRSIAGFILGMLLYFLYQDDKIKNYCKPDWLCAIVTLLLLAGMHLGIQDIYFVPLFCVLIIAFTSNTGKAAAALNNKALIYLGDISYSVYMLHFPLILIVQMIAYKLNNQSKASLNVSFWPGLGYCILFIAVLIVLSALSYKILEQPCRRYVNKWAGK
jgi:peptidoglycan/LPS O-acetylase OafA/YrhL